VSEDPTTRRAVLSSLALGLVAAAVLPGMGCAHRPRTGRGSGASPEQLQATVAAARLADGPFALQGHFTVHLDSPGTSGSTKGALVLHQPDRFRIEILSPLGTPMVLVASNGKALNAWTQKDNRFFRGADADRVLGQLTGGAVALSDVNAMLTGLLPLPQAPVRDLSEDGDGLVHLTLDAPEQVEVRAVLDPHTELTRELQVVRTGGPALVMPESVGLPALPTGETLVELRYAETMRVGRSRLPATIRLSLPTLGWKIELEFLSWDELGQIPEVFDLGPPPGAHEEDLVAALQRMAESKD